MATEVYEKVREMLDGFSIGFKSTGTGVELKLLEKLFTEEEADMYLNLSRTLKTAEDVAAKAGLDVDVTQKNPGSDDGKGIDHTEISQKGGGACILLGSPLSPRDFRASGQPHGQGNGGSDR